jgi:nucleotide-binding universal stress UspA family protein
MPHREPTLLEHFDSDSEEDENALHSNILVAVDGTPASEHAVDRAVSRFFRPGDRLDLVFVLERRRYADMRKHDAEELRHEVCVKAHELSEEYDALFARHEIKGTFHFVAAWDAVEGILSVVRKRSVDVLVVGTRGHSGFKSMILGSVSKKLAKHAECTVVIVK